MLFNTLPMKKCLLDIQFLFFQASTLIVYFSWNFQYQNFVTVYGTKINGYLTINLLMSSIFGIYTIFYLFVAVLLVIYAVIMFFWTRVIFSGFNAQFNRKFVELCM